VVVDVGCGHGATTIEAAGRVGPQGRAIGVDRDASVLSVARERAAAAGVAVTWLHADASAADLGTDGPADVVLSRFGTLHFTDPVAAHAHLRGLLRPGGRLVVTAWQGIDANAWAAIPAAVVGRHLPSAATPHRAAAGPFTFADPEGIRAVLAAAGFVDLAVEAVDRAVPIGADVAGALAFFEADAGDALRTALLADAYAGLLADLAEQLTPFAGPDAVRVPAGAWLVRATNPR
jgi:SAM-dependent methyltransferase